MCIRDRDVANTGLTAIDLSNNKNLKELFLNWTMIEAMDDEIAARLISYGVPMPTMRIDLAKFPVLKALCASGSLLEFTGVENPRQLESADGLVTLPVGEARVGGFAAYGETIDLSAQKTVGTSASRFVWTVGSDTIAHTENRLTITDDLPANYQVAGLVTNPLFPGWTVQYGAWIYTCDGDANLDKSVNVQDVTATVSYILKDKDNMIPNFGFAEADVNYNNNVEIADVIGIANIIRNEPVTKASALRSEAEAPVQMELDADNFLTMNSQVPVAGIYLELVGAIDEIPLLGDAAKFMQASSLNGDTLRVIAYSLDGRTIPSGKSRIMRLPAGVTLVGASFSDARANSLRSGGDAIVTSNAPIEAIAINENSLKKSFRKAASQASRITGSPTGKKATRNQIASIQDSANQLIPEYFPISPITNKTKETVGIHKPELPCEWQCSHPHVVLIILSILIIYFLITVQR